jgi:hypothetical protein
MGQSGHHSCAFVCHVQRVRTGPVSRHTGAWSSAFRSPRATPGFSTTDIDMIATTFDIAMFLSRNGDCATLTMTSPTELRAAYTGLFS